MSEEEKRSKIFQRLISDHWLLQERKYEVLAVALQGSQNYGLDTQYSDIDTKAVIIPSLDDLVYNKKPVSTTIVLNEQNEHIDVKDIREMFSMFRKQNPSYLELLFTPYSLYGSWTPYSEDWKLLRDNAEAIARYDPCRGISAMLGMAEEKYHALCLKRPSTAARIEKYGYDPKQLHHMLRLEDMMKGFIAEKPYAELISNPTNPKFLQLVKLGFYKEKIAKDLAGNCITNIRSMAEEYKRTHEKTKNAEVDELLDSVQYSIISNRIKNDVCLNCRFHD